jgi:hypothetical protein
VAVQATGGHHPAGTEHYFESEEIVDPGPDRTVAALERISDDARIGAARGHVQHPWCAVEKLSKLSLGHTWFDHGVADIQIQCPDRSHPAGVQDRTVVVYRRP